MQCKKCQHSLKNLFSRARCARGEGKGTSHFLGTASRLRGAGRYHQETAARLWRTKPDNEGPKRAPRGLRKGFQWQ
eukprot:6668758-Pyramimonas_sp.AAC.1